MLQTSRWMAEVISPSSLVTRTGYFLVCSCAARRSGLVFIEIAYSLLLLSLKSIWIEKRHRDLGMHLEACYRGMCGCAGHARYAPKQTSCLAFIRTSVSHNSLKSSPISLILLYLSSSRQCKDITKFADFWWSIISSDQIVINYHSL